MMGTATLLYNYCVFTFNVGAYSMNDGDCDHVVRGCAGFPRR